VCAIHYLLYKKKLRMTPFWDASHKVYRCLWNATRSAGKYTAVLLGVVVFNIEHGPWQGSANHEQIRAAAKDLQALAADGGGDPLFDYLMPKILRDRNAEVGLATSQDIIEELVSARFLEAKGAKVSPTRWGTWHNAAAERLPVWHMKAALLAFLGVRCGWLTSSSKRALVSQALRPRDLQRAAQSAEDKQTIKQSSDAVNALRDKCLGNQLHLATVAMLDADFHFEISLIQFATLPFREWDGMLIHSVRNPAACKEHYVGMAQGMAGLDEAVGKALRPMVMQ
jgi:hypothetical protein